MVEKRKAYGVLVGKPEGKRQFGRLHVDGRILLSRVRVRDY
jgi:hypothetical protein